MVVWNKTSSVALLSSKPLPPLSLQIKWNIFYKRTLGMGCLELLWCVSTGEWPPKFLFLTNKTSRINWRLLSQDTVLYIQPGPPLPLKTPPLWTKDQKQATLRVQGVQSSYRYHSMVSVSCPGSFRQFLALCTSFRHPVSDSSNEMPFYLSVNWRGSTEVTGF